ncbi:hypothetical protein MID00_16300 [Alcaligenes sp. NLF5-7]|uniref:hypothetical protein n=1 Tax=Alcaligenes sp. NLF5-7 TaxID=2918755 RepID=UPI0020C20776|nr:hypothetical protein [Alcaligenes sp. NLF5-7]UTM01039.1 hypothetical protein MID00_16300 [Alcaligenes sp. NLF5-7]
MENTDDKEPDSLSLGPNALTLWAQEHRRDYEAESAKRAQALELAIQCINNGTLTLLDGPDSPLSCRIKSHHRLSGFEMNSHWIGTAQSWQCPCCHRSKFDISRPGNKGQILAKLVEHHDHMSEALKAAFSQAFIHTETNHQTNTGLALVERMAAAFAAYDPVLICEDCNNADARAKALLSQHDPLNLKHQSFSIGQLQQFIESSPHASHQINEEALKSLWTTVRPAYKARMALIFEVAKAAVTQDHWYEKYPLDFIPVPTLENRTRIHSNQWGFEWISSEALQRAFQEKTISHRSNWSRWRQEQKKPSRTPPANYQAIILSQPGSARMWKEVDDDWHCPSCERPKHQTVKYRNGKIGFQTHSPTPRSKAWRHIPFICMDCCAVVKSMSWELTKGFGVTVQATFDSITPEQLRSIMTARPYSPPLIDSAKAKALVEDFVRNSA